MRTELLKRLLGTPTYTGQELLVTNLLVDHAAEHGYTCTVDATGNVFMTKGTVAPGEFYPLVCAHTDSVHTRQDMAIIQDSDQCLPVLKAVFFWGEEQYCKGSHAAGPEFFSDVGYCIEFDSPQSDIVSYSCDGTQLFEEHGEFAKIAVPIMDEHGMTKWQRHPYTDVAVLKRRYPFTCVNLPAGYYRMHTRHEYGSIPAVENAVVAGRKIITELGTKNYPFRPTLGRIMETDRKTTYLELD